MFLIIDFGGQSAHLIGRRLKNFGVDFAFCNPEDAAEVINEGGLNGVIFSGGPSSVYDDGAPAIDSSVYDSGLPTLAICYGWQLMARDLGGSVEPSNKEYGKATLTSSSDGILKGIEEVSQIWQSHGDSVTSLPDGFEVIGTTEDLPFAAVANESRKMYGVQFHPELEHTEHGEQMLRNFIQGICGSQIHEFQIDPDAIIADIRQTVGDDRVICAVSGGVDSSVAAFLIGKAIGSKLTPVYVDSGLMREGTTERVKYIFSELIEADLQIIDAKARFMGELADKEDPEEKRKTIGKLYVDIFEEVANQYPDAKFLGQGTIYSDVIESKGSKHASNIKSHHNVGGLPAHMRLELIEPLRNLYKDEVREVGRMVGLPEEVVAQHPFPGPGYAVRIRAEVTEKRLSQAKHADAIIMEEVENAGLMSELFQIFPVMSGAYSTAVKGDARAFAEVVAIRAYESQDIISADWSYLPRDLLAKISTRIVNEVPDISRVVYDITSKPPATMEWE